MTHVLPSAYTIQILCDHNKLWVIDVTMFFVKAILHLTFLSGLYNHYMMALVNVM